MSELLKITDIANEIKASIPEKQREKYKSLITAKALNSMLVEKGFLYRLPEGGGCRATETGKQIGIVEEDRIDYIQVLHDSQSQNIVKTIFYGTYPELMPKTFKPAFEEIEKTERIQSPDNYSYSRTFNETLRAQYPGFINLLWNDASTYYIFDECAVMLAEAFDLKLYTNANGKPGFTFSADQLDDMVKLLENGKYNFTICNSEFIEIHQVIAEYKVPAAAIETLRGPAEGKGKKPGKKPASTTVAPTPQRATPALNPRIKCIKQNEFFKLVDSESNENIFIITEFATVENIINRANGTIEVMEIPVNDLSGYIVVSPDSEMGIMARGRQLNETFECCGFEYTVTGVNLKYS